jgi:hypothetical protein
MKIKTIKLNVFEKDLIQKMKPFLISRKISPRSNNKFSAYFLFWFNSILLFPVHLTRSLLLFPLRVLGFANGYEKPNWEPIPTFSTYFNITKVNEYISSSKLQKIYLLKVDFTSNIKGEDKNGSLYCNEPNTYGLNKIYIVSVKRNKVVLNKILSSDAHLINDFDDKYDIMDGKTDKSSTFPSMKMNEVMEWKSTYSKEVADLQNKFGFTVINMNIFELPVWHCLVKSKNISSAPKEIFMEASNGDILYFTEYFKL